MKPMYIGSQNLTIYLEIRLLHDQHEASQARPMPTIRAYLWSRYHANNYSVVLLSSCELYLALRRLYLAVKIFFHALPKLSPACLAPTYA